VKEEIELLLSGDNIKLKVEALLKLVNYFPTDAEKRELIKLIKEKNVI
jgi:hypothetical protein